MTPWGVHGADVPVAPAPSGPLPLSPKVSLIVPVYGVPGDLLSACLESLQRQTLSDIEILLVLDGPDPEIQALLEKRAADDFRLVVLPLPLDASRK